MATQQEEETVVRVPQIVEELNRTMRSGITRTKEWRMQQLRAVLKLLEDNEERITKALAKDLGKSAHEGYLTEIVQATSSCKLAMKELNKWMAPQKVRTTLTTFPGKAAIIAEPLGLALIIAPWNFPFCKPRPISFPIYKFCCCCCCALVQISLAIYKFFCVVVH
jgi:aldehyde dehydrogenase (NAD+)